MSLTVSNQASNLYQQYAMQNSDTYKNNAVDPSAVSKEDYDVSNMANAMDALESADQVDLYSVGNVDSYASNLYQVSQLSDYSTLTANQTVSELLPGSSGDSSLSKIYSLIAPDQQATSEFLQSVEQKEEAKAEADINASASTAAQTDTGGDASAVDSYKQYLNSANAGALLDTSV
jgi:hypothetical protein